MSHRIRHCALGRARAGLPILLIALLLGVLACHDERQDALAAASPDARPSSLEAWRAQRARLDDTVWADERLAQQYEQTLVTLWDALLAAGRRGDQSAKLDVLSSLEFETLTLGTPRSVERLDHDIERFELGTPRRELTPREWATFLEEQRDAGYRLVQSEWHHARFRPATDASPARSLVAVVLHIVDGPGDRRISIEGDLAVEWSERRDEHGNFVPARIDANGLQMSTRSGPAAFERTLAYRSPQRADAYAGIHPVLLYDLDQDGLIDVVMVRSSRVLWNRGNREFADAPLFANPVVLTETGVVADMNGDGHADLLSTRPRGDLVLFLADEQGRFRSEPRSTPFDYPLRAPSVITVGDVDADGDLDAWLAQYKPAYADGQMPSPFYDANDGYPSYLLLNDGKGGFTPATDAAGLGEKRHRRTYVSSFVDLDDDSDLDLLVVSDYAGVDLYHNDGAGRFVDANATLRADRHLFGMSIAFADYDLDGKLDFFVAGMSSTTARRLEALGLAREDRPEIAEMRMRMAFGNRLYLASEDGWREPAFALQVARTGWTWGTTAFDFDNDGDPDLFAANGHQSGESTQDYCSNFWSHDIYDGESEPDPELAQLFGEVAEGVVSGKESWDGYQKNQLLMNRQGKGFVNVAFLLGVADEFDSRSAVSADLDRDGRVDLLVTENLADGGERLHIYWNHLKTPNGWIGVELREQGHGRSPVGASVVVRTPERQQVGRVVTGETLMGQHPTTLHFGLDGSTRVDSIEVSWIDGTKRVVRNPEPNRYHLVLAPAKTPTSRDP
jgi:hypothetical protein